MFFEFVDVLLQLQNLTAKDLQPILGVNTLNTCKPGSTNLSHVSNRPFLGFPCIN